MADPHQMSCKECLTDELRPENVAPCHDQTRLFVDSQWTTGSNISTVYLVYRVLMAVFVVAWLVADFLDEAGRWYSFDYALWLLFATNWSFILLAVSAVMMAISTVYYYVTSRYFNKELPTPISLWLCVQWLFYNIASNCAFVVSVAYWSFVLLMDLNAAQDFLMTPLSQLKHSLNSVYVIMDLFANAMPIRVYHLVYPLLVGVVYAIFNATYFLTDNRGPDGAPFAYAAMDWRHPLGSTVTCLLGCITSIVVQLVLYGLYRLRLFAHRKLLQAVKADVDGPGLTAASPLVPRGYGGTTIIPAVLADDGRGPAFPNGFDSGGVHLNAGYQSIGDIVESPVDEK